MTTVFDVPADLLINKVAEEFKNNDKIESPAWSNFVKTGVHKERKPENADWWYIRTASIIRRVYIDGPVGVVSLRTFYGGKKDRGVRPEAFKKGSGAIAARFEETHTFPTIPSSPLIRDFGIVFCGQLQSKFYITI